MELQRSRNRCKSNTPIFEFFGVPFKEAEYLHVALDGFFIDTLFTLHHLVELRMEDGYYDIEPTAPLHSLPLGHTLRVLEAHNFHHSLLAGQTFHRLKKCRVSLGRNHHDLNQDLFTEIPVCT